jgi:hypothetical protein
VAIDPQKEQIEWVETKKLRKQATSDHKMVATEPVAEGYRVGLAASFANKGISAGDLVEVSTGSVPLRGWVVFHDDLKDGEAVLSKIFFDTLKLTRGDEILLRRVGRGLAATTLARG